MIPLRHLSVRPGLEPLGLEPCPLYTQTPRVRTLRMKLGPNVAIPVWLQLALLLLLLLRLRFRFAFLFCFFCFLLCFFFAFSFLCRAFLASLASCFTSGANTAARAFFLSFFDFFSPTGRSAKKEGNWERKKKFEMIARKKPKPSEVQMDCGEHASLIFAVEWPGFVALSRPRMANRAITQDITRTYHRHTTTQNDAEGCIPVRRGIEIRC